METVMSMKKCLSDSIYGEETHVAERELCSFIAAVTELYGRQHARISEKEWVEEAELMDSSPLGTSRNWRAVTIAASTRLATRIVAEEVERSA